MKPAIGHLFGKELCEALGIDPNVTTGIVLVARFGEPATLRVTQYVDLDKVDVEKFKQIVKRYELKERTA